MLARALAWLGLRFRIQKRRGYKGSQPGDALRGADIRQPDERQTAGIELAILRERANPVHAFLFDAEEHQEIVRAFQFDTSQAARVRVLVRTHVDAAAALQPAESAATAGAGKLIARAVAAHLVLASDHGHGVADPRRLCLSAQECAELFFQARSG